MTANPTEERMRITAGPIRSIILPKGWKEGLRNTPANQLTVQTLYKFCAAENSNVQLCIYHRGHPVSKRSAASFREVLNRTRQEVSEDDLWSIQEVLGNLAYKDDFQVVTAMIRPLFGMNVLDVRGLWNNLKLSGYHIFIDVDGSGHFVYEIYYAAPYTEFDTHLAAIEAAVQSIEFEEPKIEPLLDEATNI